MPLTESAPLLLPSSASSVSSSDARSAQLSRLGLSLLVVCLGAFIVQSEVTAHVQNHFDYKKPYFILYLSHSCYGLLLVFLAAAARIADGSTASMRRYLTLSIRQLPLHPPTPPPLPHSVVDSPALPGTFPVDNNNNKLSIPFPLRMLLLASGAAFPSYCWYLAVSHTSMGNVTAIFNTSSFFAYLFSILMSVDGERFAWRKLLAVVLSLVGVAIISFGSTAAAVQGPPDTTLIASASTAVSSSSTTAAQSSVWGDLLALMGAASYGLYEALYKKYAVPAQPSVAFGNFITGCIGLVTLTALWIPIPLLHFLGVEPFALPSAEQALYIFLIALMGLVYNACFMLVIAFTSPVIAAVGVMLTIPLICITDLSLGIVASISTATVLGSVLICAGFVMLVSSYATK